MHTRNVNVKTAAQESTERWCENPVDLTPEQGRDLFAWVIRSAEGQPQPWLFSTPAEAVELFFFYDDGPDYFSVWFLQGYPVAAGIPLDGYFRTNILLINLLSGDN